MAIKLTSTALPEDKPIPVMYTRQGDNVSPPLQWSDPPEGTRSFALMCEDPDAQQGKLVWAHWVLYDLPAECRELEKQRPNVESLPGGGKQGKNAFPSDLPPTVGYNGPSPPPGETHRYFFKLYALDAMLDLEPRDATRDALLLAMKGHVLAEGELMRKYGR